MSEGSSNGKTIRWIIYFTLVIVISALSIFIWWFFWGRFTDTTDDAYVHGNQVRVTSQISGIVVSVNTDSTRLVDEGQVLVILDETDKKIAFEESKAELGNQIRKVTEMFEKVYALAAHYNLKQAEMVSREVDYLDRKQIVDTGAISDEEFIHSESAYMASLAALQMVKFNLMQAISQVQHTTVITHPLVVSAKEKVRSAYVNLARCTIKAPATGIVAMRSVQVGQTVSPNVPLLAIIPLDQMWIEANFKEVQLAKIRIGQTVRMTADTYGSRVVFTGEVLGIDGGSGAVFSPLPPQNATGNWIKIVQRVPVRISLNPSELRLNPLRLGLSMNVHVNVHDKQGPRIPQVSSEKPIWTTDIYQKQVDGAMEVIDEVIKANLTYDLIIPDEIIALVSV